MTRPKESAGENEVLCAPSGFSGVAWADEEAPWSAEIGRVGEREPPCLRALVARVGSTARP